MEGMAAEAAKGMEEKYTTFPSIPLPAQPASVSIRVFLIRKVSSGGAMTGGIFHLILALLVFAISHSLTNLPALRNPAERVLGRGGFMAAYSVLSLVLLAWMIAAYRDAPTLVLWVQEGWMRWIPAIAMIPASLLIGIGVASPNPFSIGPGRRGYDPARPGILRLTRHPVLWGLAIWAAAHVVPNGDAAALILFVPLIGLAFAGPPMLEKKRRRTLGEAEFDRLAARTDRPAWAMVPETGWRILVGVALYGLLFAAHEPVIGVSPWP